MRKHELQVCITQAENIYICTQLNKVIPRTHNFPDTKVTIITN